MTDRDDVERLRSGFRSLAQSAKDACSADDLAAVWDAVRGDLEPEARRALVARLADEPALAEAWRIAHALEAPGPRAVASVAAPRRTWSPAWLGAAAVLVLGLSAALLVPGLRHAEPVLRRPAGLAVESLVAPDAALPRAAFELRWSPGPAGSRYQVRVTSEDLRVIAAVSDLETPSYRVPADALAGVPGGGTVFWQVDVTLPAGARRSSTTFVTHVQ
ncbi:MAG: hypothetical protein AB7O28_14170 [Vicinamibacterales bacterium]